MRAFDTISEFQNWRRGISRANPAVRVGFVPTMGALHDGHRSLLERARSENDVVVLSIFVNPTQFNQASDLAKYPRTLGQDLALARAAGVDVVLIPRDAAELYPDDYRYEVREKEFSRELCGAHRPGHFEGVLTVVLKLLQLARAHRAYFGEKDYQQFGLIAGMARAFFLETEIIGCPTVREEDGLAMSSRNLRLSESERAKAPALFDAMTKFRDVGAAREALEKEGFRVDYLEDRKTPTGETRRFAAAFLGDVRLIDNVPVAGEADRETSADDAAERGSDR